MRRLTQRLIAHQRDIGLTPEHVGAILDCVDQANDAEHDAGEGAACMAFWERARHHGLDQIEVVQAGLAQYSYQRWGE
jgi:hypothetical protein